MLNEGGLAFVKPLREKRYTTLMDPFLEKYGKAVTSRQFSPLIDLLWMSIILISLGK